MAFPATTTAPTARNDGAGDRPRYPVVFKTYEPGVAWAFAPTPNDPAYDEAYQDGYDVGYAEGFADGGGGGGVPTEGQTWPRGNP